MTNEETILRYWKNREMKESFMTEVSMLVAAEDGSLPGTEVFYCDGNGGGVACSEHYGDCVMDPKQRLYPVAVLFALVLGNDIKRQEAIISEWLLSRNKPNRYFYRYVLYRLLAIFSEYNKNIEDKINLKFLSEAYLFETNYRKTEKRIERLFKKIN